MRKTNVTDFSLELLTYIHKEVWLTTVQNNQAQDPLFTVSWKHENDWLKLLRPKKCHQAAGLMTMAILVSAKLGAVSVFSVLQQRGKESVLKKKFCSAALDSRPHLSCSEDLRSSEHSGTQ